MIIKILSKSYFLLLFFVVFVFQSCISTKNVPYFQDIAVADSIHLQQVAEFTDPVIQPDDILSITISTIDPLSAATINQPPINQSQSAGGIGQSQISGYLVDKNGEVELTVVGKIKLSGLTTYQARDRIRERVARLFKDPSIQVRFANFKVTVLGEVAKPSAYTLPNEKVNILDALGLAGDLTIYGKRDNILLIRENSGKKEMVRLSLNSSDLLQSPYFYLKQNDVIYVEPNKGKAASLNQARTQTLAVIGTALTVLITLITRL